MWVLLFLFVGGGFFAYVHAQHRREAELESLAIPLVQHPQAGNIFERASSLLSEFDSLATFADARAWDRAAERAAEALQRFVADVQAFQTSADRAIAEASTAEKYAVRRTVKMVEFAREAARRASHLADELMERADFSPNDVEDQKEILAALRASKQELMLDKRELRADVAEIRRDARIASANAAPWLPVRGAAKWAAAERRAIRSQKEHALRPHEDAIEAVTRQILAIDRRVAWVKRFRKDT